MISLSLIFFICFRILFSIAFRSFTLNDRLLPNKNFESFPAIDWLHCVEACQTSPSCISYNYEVHNDKSCFLKECGFRDQCEALRNLVVSSGVIFHQLKKVLLKLPFLLVSNKTWYYFSYIQINYLLHRNRNGTVKMVKLHNLLPYKTTLC